LYDEKYSQKFLKFEEISNMPEDSVKNLFHEKMTKADEYIFVFPIWW
jgi:putative NADPH-quinone reductase